MYKQESIKRYLADLAAKKPVPGGGSAAALVSCLGISLTSMVARYTRTDGKKSLVLKKLLVENEKLCLRALELVDKDVKVFEKLTHALALPKDKPGRADMIQRRLADAAEVPFEICEVSLSAMKLCLDLADYGNKNLITDIGCSAYFSDSAFQAALLNVKINLKYIKDKRFKADKNRALMRMSKHNARLKKRVIEKVGECL